MTSINSSCVLKRCDNRLSSSEEIELIGKQDCAKNVAEMNFQTARYSYIAMGLGTTQDSETLRDELKRTRMKVCDLAQKNSSSLTTLLKNNAFNSQELPELEKLYRLFSSCLEVVEAQLGRTLTLQAAFPLQSACTVLIHTGLTEAVFAHKFCVSLEQVETPKIDWNVKEKEDMKALQRDIEDIHQLLYDLNQKLDVNPWVMEPAFSPEKLNHTIRSENSDTESSSIAQNQNAQATRVGRRRRCVCLVSVIIIIVVVLGTTAGVCIPLLMDT